MALDDVRRAALIEAAKEAILDRMCVDWRRWGDKAMADREGLQRELN